MTDDLLTPVLPTVEQTALTPPPPAMLLEARGLRREHGAGDTRVVALDGVDLTVRAGELVAVMGPSGCGKTTLLHVCAGLEEPTSGQVTVGGTLLTSLDAAGLATLRRRSIGVVFQKLNLLAGLTAAENVALPLELDGAPARRARQVAVAALAEVGLAGRENAAPHELSGGQQQRVAIARALIGPRRLLLADEPTGALDSATGLEIMKLLRARADAGAGVVLVTHEPRHAAWADRVVYLRDGKQVGA